MHCLLIVLIVLILLTPGAITRLIGCFFWGVVILLLIGFFVGGH